VLAAATHSNSDGGMHSTDRPVLDGVGHAIIATDLKGNITFWNSAAKTTISLSDAGLSAA